LQLLDRTLVHTLVIVEILFIIVWRVRVIVTVTAVTAGRIIRSAAVVGIGRRSFVRVVARRRVHRNHAPGRRTLPIVDAPMRQVHVTTTTR
jgi:hypothetical protein